MLTPIHHLSRWLGRLVTLLLLVLPTVVLVWGWRGLSRPDWPAAVFPGLPPETLLTPAKSTAVLAVGAIALVPMLCALIWMRGLFRQYAQGAILTETAARLIRRIGAALVVLAAVQFVIAPLQLLLLTAGNPPGARLVSIGITSEIVWLALAGGLLIVIGWAMAEAARADEENRGFV